MTGKEGETAEAILKMSYAEILRYLDAVRLQSRPLSVCSALTQRLYEIVLYDHHVPNADRQGAWEHLRTVKAVVEEGFKHSPDTVAKYRADNEAMEEGARKFGLGTMPWLIKENRIESTEDLIRFITRPEYRRRLEELCAVLEPEVAARLRQEVARAEE